MKANITSYLFLTILFISTFALPAPQRQRTSELGTTTRRPTRPVSSTTPANGGPESGVDIKELEPYLSPKLFTFLDRLSKIHPKKLETGELKLANIKLMGRNEMEEILQNADPAELRQFKSDLAQVAKLLNKYPGAKKLVQISVLSDHISSIEQSTSGTPNRKGSASTTSKPNNKSSQQQVSSTRQPSSAAEDDFDNIDPFFEEFTKVDKELSKYPEWNRYWSFWFRRYGDYMAKYG